MTKNIIIRLLINLTLKLIVFFALSTVSCSDSSSSISDTSFIEPDFSTTYTLVEKNYAFNHASLNEIYGTADSNCVAIYYNGTVGGESYEGIAVRDSHESSPDFNLKIYKKADEAHYTLKIIKGNTSETITDENDYVTIAVLDDNRYSCTFQNDLTGTNFTILATDQIIAQKY